MRYLTDRNLEEAQLVFVTQLNGCNVYVPEAYNTPLSYLQPGCPIWIQVDAQHRCRVYELEGNMPDANMEIEAIVNSLNI